MTEKEKQEWLDRVEQNTVETVNELKKNLQDNNLKDQKQ